MLKYHFVRIAVEDGELELKYVPATDNPADILTKALKTVKLHNYMTNIIFPGTKR